MDLHEGDWVLVDGKHEAYVIREDHFKNPNYALISNPVIKELSLRYVNKNRLTKLDPVLYPFLESEYERVRRSRV